MPTPSDRLQSIPVTNPQRQFRFEITPKKPQIKGKRIAAPQAPKAKSCCGRALGTTPPRL